jgi:hypothetical protein
MFFFYALDTFLTVHEPEQGRQSYDGAGVDADE